MTQAHEHTTTLREAQVLRRDFLAGAASLLVAACGGGGGSSATTPVSLASVTPSPTPSPTPTPAAAVYGPEVVTVQQFYKAGDGNNLQPAFQAALDAAAARGLRKVVNDMAGASGEMWCPLRKTLDDYQTDGIPLVVRQPVAIDFRNITLSLKGVGGGNRMAGQPVSFYPKPLIGGWMNVVGHPGFDLISVENVVVDGGYAGVTRGYGDVNLTDKAFRVQDTEVERVFMKNVELRNFAGEIYYIGGLGPKLQEIEDCHFHGSPQCAWNPGGIGKVVATNLQAGNSYQAAEVIGGQGHTYNGGRFYDSGTCTFLSGPKPGFQPDYPYSYAYWDGVGEKPLITFKDTIFDYTPAVSLSAWMRGNIITIDTPVWLNPNVGHLRDWDLAIESRIDNGSNFEALGLFGPASRDIQVGGAKPGTFLVPPSDLNIRLKCVRTARAVANGQSHIAAVRYFGGLFDSASIAIELSGEARQAFELFNPATPGFVMPKISTTNFRTL